MSAATQAHLLRQHLRDLQKMRTDGERLYRELDTKVRANKANLNFKMKMVEGIAFIGQALIGVAKIAGATAAAVKQSGQALAASNRKALVELGKQGRSKTRGGVGLIYDPENALLDLAINFDSPNYWAKKITGVNPDVLFNGLLRQIDDGRKTALAQIDGFINESQAKLRYCEAGGDLSRVA